MWPFGSPAKENVALIDISSTSVGAAYAVLSKKTAPHIVYSVRIPFDTKKDAQANLMWTLGAVSYAMATKGAPLLRKSTGNGGVHRAQILVSSPWQTAVLHIESIEKKQPFSVTASMLSDALAKAKGNDAAVIATVLNGYETGVPIGKRVTRAEIYVLSSKQDTEVWPRARSVIRQFAGAQVMKPLSFPILAYSILRRTFAAQSDFMTLRIGRETSDIAFVRRGLLAGIETVSCGSDMFFKAAQESGLSAGALVSEHDLIDAEKNKKLGSKLLEAKKSWLSCMRGTLADTAAKGGLPRTIFLFTEADTEGFFKRLIDTPELHDLWLSDEPLAVSTISSGYFSSFVKYAQTAPEDAVLSMLALFAAPSS
ncbi:hypothetical protein L0Y34_02360 [Candidatus Parcubacteria bacterium]|nr:hypothetical protein [Candidatus Parcubacteria bacterium]